MHYIIVGGAGFIGSEISRDFLKRGYRVTVMDLVSSRVEGVESIVTDFKKPPASISVDGAVSIINLAGKSIFGRFTIQHKNDIYSSRIDTTQALYDWCVDNKISVHSYVGASAVGYYGSRPGFLIDEATEAGSTFLSQVCVDWEAAHQKFSELGARVVILRQGHVLGKGGLLGVLAPLFKIGLGGTLGNGRQFMPWIAMSDLVNIYRSASSFDAGVYNAVSNLPITNKEFSRALAKHFGMPLLFTIPLWALRLRFSSFADEMVVDQKISGNKIAQVCPVQGDLGEALNTAI